MLLRMKAKRNDERIDRVQQDLLMAVKVSEEEINAAAGSPDLYDGLRARIAAGRAQPGGGQRAEDYRRAGGRGVLDLSPAPWPRPSLRWTLTAAAAILLLAALATLLLLPRQSRLSPQIAPAMPRLVPSPPD